MKKLLFTVIALVFASVLSAQEISKLKLRY